MAAWLAEGFGSAEMKAERARRRRKLRYVRSSKAKKLDIKP